MLLLLGIIAIWLLQDMAVCSRAVCHPQRQVHNAHINQQEIWLRHGTCGSLRGVLVVVVRHQSYGPPRHHGCWRRKYPCEGMLSAAGHHL